MTYEHVTLCFSLPRSRSQWLAWLYSHAVESWHDPLKHCESPLDLKARIDACKAERIFIADTSAILFHGLLSAALPGARRLYVLRDPREVCESLKRETGYPRRRMVDDLFARVEREAKHALPSSVAFCGAADWLTRAWPRGEHEHIDRRAAQWWPAVTGRPPLAPGFYASRIAIRIDTPVREQPVWPEKRAALMAHAEK